MIDVEAVRKDFPILEREINGQKIVYFDNAASSQKPVQVVEKMRDFYYNTYANVHRGVHTLSQEASEQYEEAHAIIASLIGARKDEIVFTMGTTDSLNMLAYGLESTLAGGDEIVTTVMEHHSNYLPWKFLAERKKAKLKIIDVDDEGRLNYAQLENLISPRTKIVAVCHMSNVTGFITDVGKIARIAHETEAYVVVDGAQSVPHLPVNVKELDIDFMAFSGHKMLGPTGIGVLYGKKDLLEELTPYRYGGGMISRVTLSEVEFQDVPWRLEAGTPNIVQAVGLAEAVKYLKKVGMENIESHEKQLVKKTLTLIQEELKDKIKIVGPQNQLERGGLVAFTVKGLDHHTVASLLDAYGVMVRSGKHCAHPLHERLGLEGTVRASFYLYNTEHEVERFIQALAEIVGTVD